MSIFHKSVLWKHCKRKQNRFKYQMNNSICINNSTHTVQQTTIHDFYRPVSLLPPPLSPSPPFPKNCPSPQRSISFEGSCCPTSMPIFQPGTKFQKVVTRHFRDIAKNTLFPPFHPPLSKKGLHQFWGFMVPYHHAKNELLTNWRTDGRDRFYRTFGDQ